MESSGEDSDSLPDLLEDQSDSDSDSDTEAEPASNPQELVVASVEPTPAGTGRASGSSILVSQWPDIWIRIRLVQQRVFTDLELQRNAWLYIVRMCAEEVHQYPPEIWVLFRSRHPTTDPEEAASHMPTSDGRFDVRRTNGCTTPNSLGKPINHA